MNDDFMEDFNETFQFNQHSCQLQLKQQKKNLFFDQMSERNANHDKLKMHWLFTSTKKKNEEEEGLNGVEKHHTNDCNDLIVSNKMGCVIQFGL